MSINRDPMKPIDILFLTKDDWANDGYKYWQCLRLLDLNLNIMMFKGDMHKFGYSPQAPLHPSLAGDTVCLHPRIIRPISYRGVGIESLIQSAHVVHFMGSHFVDAQVDWSQVNVVVTHAGTTYREDPEACNRLFNPIASVTTQHTADLLGLGAHNEHLVLSAVDTDEIKPVFDRADPDALVIGHFPSNTSTKGTEKILGVLDRLRADGAEFKYIGADSADTDVHRLSWSENLQRAAKADIIIDALKPELRGRRYGEWCNSALEASALGKIVISHSLRAADYEREYAPVGFRIANDENRLEGHLRELLSLSDEDLLAERQRARQWAVDNHSMEATARRLWDVVYKQFFME